MVKEIRLTQGKVALVDDEDFELVSRYTWFLSPGSRKKKGRCTFYARSSCGDGGRRTIRMHRIILDAPAGMDVDHRNGNGLDNRRSNLRLATRSQNSANRHAVAGTSQYQGVYWERRDRRWRAQITVNYVRMALGTYRTEEDAARAYDAAALEHFGEFASLNFPNA